MPHRIDDARRWRARAEEARELAGQLTNAKSRRLMLDIAVNFIELAQLAAERDAARRRGSICASIQAPPAHPIQRRR